MFGTTVSGKIIATALLVLSLSHCCLGVRGVADGEEEDDPPTNLLPPYNNYPVMNPLNPDGEDDPSSTYSSSELNQPMRNSLDRIFHRFGNLPILRFPIYPQQQEQMAHPPPPPQMKRFSQDSNYFLKSASPYPADPTGQEGRFFRPGYRGQNVNFAVAQPSFFNGVGGVGGGRVGRGSAFMMTPPQSGIGPRKRQILFRQCFFNPISCF